MIKIKSAFKEVLKKLPVFIFCVLFINGYNYLFGVQNSIVGVVILMGMLIFLKGDFGISPVLTSILIPLFFVLMGIISKISLISPFFGVPLNALFIFTSLLFCYGDNSNCLYLPFLMGYLMLQGYDVSGVLFEKRMISLIFGGILVAAVYFLKNRKNKPSQSLRKVISNFSWTSTKTLWILRLTITLIVVTFLCQLLNFPKFMWINLTILSLLCPFEEVKKQRHYSRIPATIIGCVLFYLAVQYIITDQTQGQILLLLGFASMFITSYFLKTIYNSFSALFAAVLLFPVKEAIIIRISANLIGVLLALIASVLFNFVESKTLLKIEQKDAQIL